MKNLSSKEYAAQKLKDNAATIKHYVGGNHVLYLALFGSIVDCDISMEQNRDDSKKFAFFYRAKCELIRQFEIYCHINKDTLTAPNPSHDKIYNPYDRKPQ